MKTAHNIIMTLCVIAVVIGLCGSENPDGSVNPIGPAKRPAASPSEFHDKNN